MTIHDLIQHLVLLALEASERDEDLRRTFGVEAGLTYGEDASVAYLQEAEALADPLVQFLGSVPTGELRRIVAIMIAGCDASVLASAGTFARLEAGHGVEAGISQDRSECIRQLAERLFALPRHFREAEQAAARLGIAWDADLERAL